MKSDEFVHAPRGFTLGDIRCVAVGTSIFIETPVGKALSIYPGADGIIRVFRDGVELKEALE